MNKIVVHFKKLHSDAVLPSYAHKGDACMDITAVHCEYDEKLECWVYNTGLAVAVPEGHVMNIMPRSSNRKTDYYMPNHVAKIDSNYRGEILICYKSRHGEDNKPPYEKGDRIAQCEVIPYPLMLPVWIDDLDETDRKGGFGSSGR